MFKCMAGVVIHGCGEMVAKVWCSADTTILFEIPLRQVAGLADADMW